MRDEGDLKMQQENLREVGTKVSDFESSSAKAGSEINAMQAANVKSAQSSLMAAKGTEADVRVQLQDSRKAVAAAKTGQDSEDACKGQNMTATQEEALAEAKAKLTDLRGQMELERSH